MCLNQGLLSKIFGINKKQFFQKIITTRHENGDTWPVITDVDGARRIECSAIKPKALEARGEKYN